jgi:hypothetical protein
MDASPEASQENDQKTTEQKIGSEHKNHSNNWPSHPETDGFQFHMWLKDINSGTSAHVIPHVISWINKENQANWSGWMTTNDHKPRKTASTFTKRNSYGKKTLIALFSTESQNWVGLHKEQQIQATWHSFTMCLCTAGRSQLQLIIYDVDPARSWLTGKNGKRSDIHWVQRHVIKELQRNSKNMTVWYYNQTTHSGKGMCTKFATDKVLELARYGDEIFTGPTDPRVAECVVLHLNTAIN